MMMSSSRVDQRNPFSYMSRIKINCLKWGALYGPEYVNRAYGGLLKHCREPFHFVCYTDNVDGISSRIEVKDIQE